MAPFLDDFSPAKKQDLADKLIKSLNSFILDKAFELALGAGVGKFLANAGETLQEAVKEATTNLKDFAVDKLSKEEREARDKADAREDDRAARLERQRATRRRGGGRARARGVGGRGRAGGRARARRGVAKARRRRREGGPEGLAVSIQFHLG